MSFEVTDRQAFDTAISIINEETEFTRGHNHYEEYKKTINVQFASENPEVAKQFLHGRKDCITAYLLYWMSRDGMETVVNHFIQLMDEYKIEKRAVDVHESELIPDGEFSTSGELTLQQMLEHNMNDWDFARTRFGVPYRTREDSTVNASTFYYDDGLTRESKPFLLAQAIRQLFALDRVIPQEEAKMLSDEDPRKQYYYKTSILREELTDEQLIKTALSLDDEFLAFIKQEYPKHFKVLYSMPHFGRIILDSPLYSDIRDEHIDKVDVASTADEGEIKEALYEAYLANEIDYTQSIFMIENIDQVTEEFFEKIEEGETRKVRRIDSLVKKYLR